MCKVKNVQYTTKVTDAEGYETTYTYDGNGNTTSMITMTDENGNTFATRLLDEKYGRGNYAKGRQRI